MSGALRVKTHDINPIPTMKVDHFLFLKIRFQGTTWFFRFAVSFCMLIACLLRQTSPFRIFGGQTSPGEERHPAASGRSFQRRGRDAQRRGRDGPDQAPLKLRFFGHGWSFRPEKMGGLHQPRVMVHTWSIEINACIILYNCSNAQKTSKTI